MLQKNQNHKGERYDDSRKDEKYGGKQLRNPCDVEEGNRLAQIYGAENVFDFSLGNPNVPAPEAVKQAMIDILNEEDPVALHGYTNSNAGYADVSRQWQIH